LFLFFFLEFSYLCFLSLDIFLCVFGKNISISLYSETCLNRTLIKQNRV
jgi:hypothetical protein